MIQLSPIRLNATCNPGFYREPKKSRGLIDSRGGTLAINPAPSLLTFGELLQALALGNLPLAECIFLVFVRVITASKIYLQWRAFQLEVANKDILKITFVGRLNVVGSISVDDNPRW